MQPTPENVIAFPVPAREGYVAPVSICPNRHNILSRPVILISVFMHRRLGAHPTVSKYTIVFSAMFGGAYMACNPVSFLPHFVWDAISYSIHGIGIAPLAETILRRAERLGKRVI